MRQAVRYMFVAMAMALAYLAWTLVDRYSYHDGHET
jgi:hypothetical protein